MLCCFVKKRHHRFEPTCCAIISTRYRIIVLSLWAPGWGFDCRLWTHPPQERLQLPDGQHVCGIKPGIVRSQFRNHCTNLHPLPCGDGKPDFPFFPVSSLFFFMKKNGEKITEITGEKGKSGFPSPHGSWSIVLTMAKIKKLQKKFIHAQLLNELS